MKKLEFNFTLPPRPPPWRRSCWSSWARPGSGSRPCSCRWPWTRPRWWSGAWWTPPPGHHHHYFFTIIINDDLSLYLDLAVPPPGQVRQDGKHLEYIKLWSDFIFYNPHTISSLNCIISLASTNMRLIWVLCAQTWSWEMSILFMILRTLNISLSVNSPRPLGSNLVEEKHFQNIY